MDPGYTGMNRTQFIEESNAKPALRRKLLLLSVVLLVVVLVLTWPVLQERFQILADGTPSAPQAAAPETSSPSPTHSNTPTAESGPVIPALELFSATQATSSSLEVRKDGSIPGPWDQGLIILAAQQAGHSHIFAYQPFAEPFIRLTSGDWDDIHPAISPNGSLMAFSSNRSGFWDLYLMSLASGEVSRLTDTPEFEGSPSFSPDGRWLVYERYLTKEESGDLELYIQAIEGDEEPIRLTEDPAADFSPSWSPLGRQIAFVSNRSGENEIWLADLDKVDERFINLSQSSRSVESHPSWSPDGIYLAWSSKSEDGVDAIQYWAFTTSGLQPNTLIAGTGTWPVWSPNSRALLTGIETPNAHLLTGYNLDASGLILPAQFLGGTLEGLAWGPALIPEPVLEVFRQENPSSSGSLWESVLTPATDIPNGRKQVSPLEGIEAPQPYLNDQVDESFQALRQQIAYTSGWDFLSSLENAFVPLTSPLLPGMSEDWLYTGRAFAFNTLSMNAGWLVVVRDDFGAETYWRVYIRARFQDGTQGRPLHDLPWNFQARYEGDPLAYEQGGLLAEAVPAGYWVDVTGLAQAYGWERLSALSTWRSAYTTARFNTFVLRDGIDWKNAMLELYPAQALVTPTVTTPTIAPSATPRPTRTPTPTRTLRPTATVKATLTSTATVSATPTPTP